MLILLISLEIIFQTYITWLDKDERATTTNVIMII